MIWSWNSYIEEWAINIIERSLQTRIIISKYCISSHSAGDITFIHRMIAALCFVRFTLHFWIHEPDLNDFFMCYFCTMRGTTYSKSNLVNVLLAAVSESILYSAVRKHVLLGKTTCLQIRKNAEHLNIFRLQFEIHSMFWKHDENMDWSYCRIPSKHLYNVTWTFKCRWLNICQHY